MNSLSIHQIKAMLEEQANNECLYYHDIELEKVIVFNGMLLFAYATAYVSYFKEDDTNYFEATVELRNFELQFK